MFAIFRQNCHNLTESLLSRLTERSPGLSTSPHLLSSYTVDHVQGAFSVAVSSRLFILFYEVPFMWCRFPASILYKSTAGRYRPVSYPDGPKTAAIDLCRMLTGFMSVDPYPVPWEGCSVIVFFPGYFHMSAFTLRKIITKTYLYKFDPLKPHFYIVKLGFIGYTLSFLFLLKNRLWVLVRTVSMRMF